MFKPTRLLTFVVLLTAAWLMGCEKPPQMEMDSAKKAVETARAAEAEKYATPQFKALQDSLRAAEAEVQHQNERFVLLRNYDNAKKSLANVNATSEKVAQASRDNKEKIRRATKEKIDQASVAIDSTAALLKRAPRGKESREELQLMETNLTNLGATLQTAKSAYDAENFSGAQQSADSVQAEANKIQQEVGAVIARYEELKGKGKKRR